MRVAINALAVEPRRPGGDVTYVRALVRWLPRVAPDVDWVVLTSRAGRALFPPTEPANGPRYVVCPIDGRSLVARALWEQLVLPRVVARIGADVLHAPVNVAPLRAGVPVVLTLHEAEPFMPDNHIPLPLLAWWRTVRARSAKRAARRLTVSRAARADLARWMGLPAASIDVVPLGVDHERFYPALASASGAEAHPLQERPYVLWIGRPYPGKNLGRLVAAFAALHRQGRAEELVLLGPPGWAEAELGAAIARHGCAAAVRRVPATWEDVPRWYRWCRAFVYPSTRESFGLPVLEAMACGAPVVASDIPALQEVAGDAAALVEPHDLDALVGALGGLLDDAERRQALRERGLARAALFDWRRTAEMTAAVYGEVAGSAGRLSRRWK